MVVKRSGGKEPFDAPKLEAGVERAVAGSAIDEAAVEALVAGIEEHARALGHEVTSEWIGLAVLERLRVLDPVSYVRFASVYKGFDDLGDFEREVGSSRKRRRPRPAERILESPARKRCNHSRVVLVLSFPPPCSGWSAAYH